MIRTGKKGRLYAGRWLVAATTAATTLSAAVVNASAGQAAASSLVPDHIFYIMMENHSYSQTVDNPTGAPYTTKLAHENILATNFHGVTHPSLSNYLAAVSGDYQGIFDDCKAGATVKCAPEEFVPNSGDGTSGVALTPQEYTRASNTPHAFTGRNIVDQLEAKNISWKAYMENLPAAGSQVEYAPTEGGTTYKLYAQKHNPFMYFTDIITPNNRNNPNPRLNKIVPFERNFASDLSSMNTTPAFAFISPNQCHDMHGVAQVPPQDAGTYANCNTDAGTIALGDNWLNTWVTKIKNSPAWSHSNSVIVIAWDENDYSTDTSGGPGSPTGANGAVLGGGPAPLIVVSNQHNGYVPINTSLDHYSTLYAIQQAWGLGCLGYTCKISNDGRPMTLVTGSPS